MLGNSVDHASELSYSRDKSTGGWPLLSPLVESISWGALIFWHFWPVTCAEQAPALQKALRQKVAGAGGWKSGWHELNWWGPTGYGWNTYSTCCKRWGFTRQRKTGVTQRHKNHEKNVVKGLVESGLQSDEQGFESWFHLLASCVFLGK